MTRITSNVPGRRIPAPALLASLAALGLAALGGCSGGDGAEEGAAGDGGSTMASSDVLLAAMPDDVVDIATAKPGLAEGETVALRGRIGGTRAPMTGESGTFIMMDLGPKYCLPDEGCPTPWDYCCTPGDVKVASNATVQLVAADGTPLAADFAALGLEPLDEVVVVGTVGPRPDPGVLVVRATGVHEVSGG